MGRHQVGLVNLCATSTHRDKNLASFRINGLAQNCVQVIDSMLAYMYPCVPVGVSQQNGHFRLRTYHTRHTSHTGRRRVNRTPLVYQRANTLSALADGESNRHTTLLPHESGFSEIGIFPLQTKSQFLAAKSGRSLTTDLVRTTNLVITTKWGDAIARYDAATRWIRLSCSLLLSAPMVKASSRFSDRAYLMASL